MFRLLRFFSIASLFAFIIVTIVLGLWYRNLAVNDLIEQEQGKNVALTKAFANSLWSEVAPYLEATAEFDADRLLRDPRITELRASIFAQMQGLSIVKVKIYDLDGRAVFSTQLDQIGEDKSDNAGFQAGRAGGVASELTHRDTFSAFEGEIEDRDVLSSYIPFRNDHQTGDIMGVFEVYSDVTPLLTKINNTQRQVMGGVALILATLYLGLFFIVRHADHIIVRQVEERKQVYQELTQQQRALAMLQERERLARELHDNLGQILGFINVQTQAAIQLLNRGKNLEADQLLQRLHDVAKTAQTDVREQILNLRSGSALDTDFRAALQEYLAQFSNFSNIKVNLVGLEQLDAIGVNHQVEIQLLRIIQEALTNVRKHAQAQRITLSLAVQSEQIHVVVEDDGCGFDLATAAGAENGYHIGLNVMRERAEEVGGQFAINSQPGRGAKVIIDLPIQPALAMLFV
ncbi:MAG: sensor histidine kinase [Caldilineaceae bacterium]|nr:sensor histidine kinase [Caldilineaceae bacterium]